MVADIILLIKNLSLIFKKIMKSTRFFYPGLFAALSFSLGAMPLQAQQTKAFEQTSQAVYRLDEPVRQVFIMSNASAVQNTLHQLSAVQVQITASTDAQISSELCTVLTGHCVPIHGRRLYTKDFNQFNADTDFYVQHRVRNWSGTYPPIFIKTQLNLWWR